MTEAYDWSWLRAGIPQIDLDTYLAMPEDLAQAIEVKDGMPVHCESPSPNHIAVTDTIKQALRESVRKRGPGMPCIKASGELDMLVSEVPFNFRRPDAIVYRCIDDPRDKWKTKPTAADTLLVVEVVSPATVTMDCVDKRAEYARLGIEQYWIVRMENNDGRVKSIEILRLNSAGEYVVTDTRFRAHSPVAVAITDPLDVSITWDALDADLD
ncbi:Uma2 family endonuclease [Nocardia cyriacigeorgica]|uniref:Uma2 family endonuclease n=1 Tax=Nocardia cyriacigeorgica TaxID=135487 RepID=UPI0018960CDD|nr:Uma2 family endonuclease [Nocardia cyriacigeorgica]MBF6435632.1 Uma2 family endonuclease [Nocardia cyriacigeorgica]MBF6454288.1 Uma2 family endonuclease [Nocardia cyriacigeorgica]MBF6479564.1 Uma2 family endonuclease [Nocardia cyriacigeorgica]MBF6552182.1 Uma2 family endonuclease [Nocardia cyriacigeorgica]